IRCNSTGQGERTCPASWRAYRGGYCRNGGRKARQAPAQPLGLRGPWFRPERWGSEKLLWSWVVLFAYTRITVAYENNPKPSRYNCQVYKCDYIPFRLLRSEGALMRRHAGGRGCGARG